MSDRHNAEPWERTTLVISEEHAAPPRAHRRLIARGRSVRHRRVGPRVAEGSEAGLVQVIAARVQEGHGSTGQSGRGAPPPPRDRGANETRFAGALHQKPVGDNNGAI
jgi:hypothetical protein